MMVALVDRIAILTFVAKKETGARRTLDKCSIGIERLDIEPRT